MMRTEKLNMEKVKVRRGVKLYGRLGGCHERKKYSRHEKHLNKESIDITSKM